MVEIRRLGIDHRHPTLYRNRKLSVAVGTVFVVEELCPSVEVPSISEHVHTFIVKLLCEPLVIEPFSVVPWIPFIICLWRVAGVWDPGALHSLVMATGGFCLGGRIAAGHPVKVRFSVRNVFSREGRI